MAMVRAYIGLGANVGDAKATLTAAVHALAALPGASLAGVSRLYVTTPVEVADQPDFHNAVVALDVPAGPDGPGATGPIALLLALKSIERAFGRQDRFRYGPRELDLDLLLFGEERIAVERPEEGRSPDPAKATRLLEVPHPEVGRRLFVLAPLADLAPDLVPPGWTESVEQARARQESIEGASAVRPIARWDLGSGAWAGPES
jgi:2-amino-4-hydroxy-6-hydroxymethyldihydropteridine diphosphokinase